MPFVRITIVRETLADDPSGKKAAISSKIAAAIAEATGLPEREISIVFDEVDARNWYVGSTDVETLRFRS
ncbi:4-oxalocrotonate tautomerase [Shinella sp. BE166]|uniref:tautomerase family protein n=1 Tax=Shinella sp. BE166 TaxID=3373918 RepID=UPI003EBC4ED1